MAKQRMINTKFWSDGWVRKINPLDRYLFLYLLSNEHTNICGIYELPIAHMAFETGIDERDLEKSMLPKLSPKVLYKDGWVILPNFIKHQNSRSPKIIKGIQAELENIPKKILDFGIRYGYGMDTISHPNTNSNLNSNTNAGGTENKKIMYNYEEIDESGNPLKRGKTKIDKKTNDMLISVGFLWQELAARELIVPKKDVVMLRIYFPIRELYDREKWNKEQFKKLFLYFLKDPGMKLENKLSFDLCMSQKYVAKFKMAEKNKVTTNVSISNEVEL